MNLSAQIIFWISVLGLLYTYVGYALLVVVVSKIAGRAVNSAAYTPYISFIITAYNEERDLRAKLENTLALDYPQEKLEIIVASDCSTDATDEIVRSFASQGVRLHRQLQRKGKTAAQNAAVELAKGDVILFSDATTLYRPNVLKVIAPDFADATVGCVAGQLIYVDSNESGVGRGAVSYWNYEVFLKKHESMACSLIGVSGCLYAVRRSAYIPLEETACSDFIIATKMVEQGLRAVYQPNAICTEETNSKSHQELRMRVRVITQTYNDLWQHRSMMNPFRSGFYSVQLFSHKVLRYFVPVMLLAIFLSSAFLAWNSTFFSIIFAAQVVSYALAGLGWILERAGLRAGPLALPYYFVLVNLAAVIALFHFIKGERYGHWEPIRELPLDSGVS